MRNETLVRAGALELFGELGTELTHGTIAERAGVGRATVYRTFPTRDELLTAMCADRVELVSALLARALAHDNPWGAQVQLTR
jgi:AcrR family transcriptional regulator